MFLILALITSSLVVTPQMWSAVKSEFKKERSSINFGENKISRQQIIEQKRVEFEDMINDIISQYPDLYVYTFVVKSVKGNKLVVEYDSENGVAYIVLPDNTMLEDINRVYTGKDGKKHFGVVNISELTSRVPCIVGIIADRLIENNGIIKFNKVEQVFFVEELKQ